MGKDGKREIWAGRSAVDRKNWTEARTKYIAGQLKIHVLGSAHDQTKDDTAVHSAICQG